MLILGICVSISSTTSIVYATSGACSSHGGVDCGAGADWDGSVICEDGWTGSSVSYYDMDSCEDDSASTFDYETYYYDLTKSTCSGSTFDWSTYYWEQRGVCYDEYSGYGALTDCLNEYDSSTGDSFSNWITWCSGTLVNAYPSCLSDVYTDTVALCLDEANSSLFSDVSTDNAYYTAISGLYQTGVIEGYEDGTYKPDAEINRAEFIKILIGWTDTSAFDGLSWDCFTDVFSSEWYAKYVFIAQAMGYIDGYPDGSFRPSDTINVVEALKITFNTIQFDVPTADGEWYEAYVDYAKSNGLYLDSWNSADQKITRGEMAELFYQAISTL